MLIGQRQVHLTRRQRTRWAAFGGTVGVLVGVVAGLLVGSVGLSTAHAPSVPRAGATPEAAGQAVDPNSPEAAADLAAIAALRTRQEDAWARGDGPGYASIYAEDADLVNFLGEHLHTRRGIAEGMQRHFDTALSGTRLHKVAERVRFLSPTMAVVVREGCVLRNDEATCRDDDLFINTNVAVKHNGEWLITSFQNTRITAT